MIELTTITITIPIISIRLTDTFISLWLIFGGLGVCIQQFSIPLTLRMNSFKKFTTSRFVIISMMAYALMLAFPPLSYYFTVKMWRNKK